MQRTIQLHELSGRSVPWDVYKHLGMAQEGLGQKANAASSYQQALESGGAGLPESSRKELQNAIERALR